MQRLSADKDFHFKAIISYDQQNDKARNAKDLTFINHKKIFTFIF